MQKTYLLVSLSLIFISMSAFKACSRIEIDENCDNTNPSYLKDIKPLTNNSCAISACHIEGYKHGDYTTYKGLKKHADDGSLLQRVVKGQSMPRGKEAKPLTKDDIELFNCWIKAGAPNN